MEITRRGTGVFEQPRTCNRVTSRVTIFLSSPPRSKEKEERKERSILAISASGSTKRSHLGLGKSTIVDRYRAGYLEVNAIEVFRNDVVCFSSILYALS